MPSSQGFCPVATKVEKTNKEKRRVSSVRRRLGASLCGLRWIVRGMAAQLQFVRDVTLGSDEHPAVQPPSAARGSISGALLPSSVPGSAPFNSTRFHRVITGHLNRWRARSVTGDPRIREYRLSPQTLDIDRSVSSSVFDLVGTRLWRASRVFRGRGQARGREKIANALASSASTVLRTGPIGTLFGDRCRAVCLRGCCSGRAPDVAVRTLQRH